MISFEQSEHNEYVYADIKNINKLTRVSIDKCMYALGKRLQKESKAEILKKPKHGKVYFYKSKTGRRIKHIASAPGEAPANMTGNLWRKLFFNPQRKRLKFGDNADYSGYLELGTKFMKKRPFLLSIIEKNRGYMKSLFASEFKRAKNAKISGGIE